MSRPPSAYVMAQAVAFNKVHIQSVALELERNVLQQERIMKPCLLFSLCILACIPISAKSTPPTRIHPTVSSCALNSSPADVIAGINIVVCCMLKGERGSLRYAHAL